MIFRIDGGDGDQSIFSEAFLAETCRENWFPGTIIRGRAWLLKVVSGKNAGRYIAITSKTTTSIEDQLEKSNWISVVVHLIERTGDKFTLDNDNVRAFGMAAIEKV